MKTLYLGTDPTNYKTKNLLVHYPMIKIVPRQVAFPHWDQYTHILFTSKNAVKALGAKDFSGKTLIAIGQITAKCLPNPLVSSVETQEGLVTFFQTLDLQNAYILFPRSSLSRPVLIDYFEKEKIAYDAIDLYDTLFQKPEPVPNLGDFDEIVFTSPSTIQAFFLFFGKFPAHITPICLGPITEACFQEMTAKL